MRGARRKRLEAEAAAPPPAPPLTYAERALRYALAVVAGEIAACKWVRLACQRHLDDLERAKGADFEYRFDGERAAVRICRFIETHYHVKGRWAAKKERIRLEDWQCFVLCVVFGWVHKLTGFRRFRRAAWFLPRKNAKSTTAAGVGLYGFAADGYYRPSDGEFVREYGAEVYSGATTEYQALEVFRPAWLMTARNEDFKAHYSVELGGTWKNPQAIFSNDTYARFHPLIGKPGEGSSPSVAIVDEYWEHSDSTQYDAMRTGMGAREQPLLLVISTAGTDLASPCYGLWREGQRVLEGTIVDETFFCIVYTIDGPETVVLRDNGEAAAELRKLCTCAARRRRRHRAPAELRLVYESHGDDCAARQASALEDDGSLTVRRPGDDWTTELALRKANPNYDISVSGDSLRGLQRTAMNDSSKQNSFLRTALNVWVNAHTAWMNMEWWHRQADATLTAEQFAGEDGVLAVDLSSKIDLAELAKGFRRDLPDGPGGKLRPHVYVFGRHYLPEVTATEPGKDHYHGWMKDGYLTVTEGASIDLERIEEDVLGEGRRHNIFALGYDPWGATQFAQRLKKQGVPVVEIPQNVQQLSDAMKWTEALVKDGCLHHTGDPIQSWGIANIVAKVDANENVFPRRETDDGKIDPGVGVIMLVKLLMAHEPPPTSIYERHGESEWTGAAQAGEQDSTMPPPPTAGETGSEPLAARPGRSIYDQFSAEEWKR